MKRCSYCGTEYPDDATECAIDKTPLGEVPPEASVHPTLSFKIPISLAIVSYLFFFPAAMSFAVAIFMLVLLIISGGQAVSGPAILGCVVSGALGLFWLSLSRGLRRCSRGWRTCALVLIWLGFIYMSFSVARYFLTYKIPHHETATEFLLVYAFPLWCRCGSIES